MLTAAQMQSLPAFFREIPDISSMAQLVEFTAEIAGLKQAVPAFL